MTIDVSNNNPIVEYSVAEGVTQTVFAVPFDYFEDSDVKIYVDGVLKVEGTDYTMVGGGGSTGTITFVTATPPEVQQVTGATGGSTVMVIREVSLERVTDFVAGMDINRAALNTQLDTLTAIAADIDSKINRSIRFPMSSNILDPLPEEDRSNKYLAFNSNGDPVYTAGTSSTIVVSSFMEPLLASNTGSNFLVGLGVTSSIEELNKLDGLTSSVGELNKLDGVTVGATEINRLAGVTSDIQGQIDSKQSVNATLTSYSSTLSAANKIPFALSAGVAGELDFKDEDDMLSNSAAAVPSQQSVKSYVDSQLSGIQAGIGYGQSWQNMAGLRASGVSYQNTTDKPIMVSAVNTAVSGGSNISAQVSTDNVTFVTVSSGSSYFASHAVTFIVPPNHWYRVSGPLQLWAELR